MLVTQQILPWLLLASSVYSQRPADTSICDYYTTALLKDNTPANQYTLLTLVVNTVGIGNYTKPNVGITVPGILAPGVFNGEKINLLPYFNGCLKSTNRGGKPIYLNFLDGGGAAPIMKNMPANDMYSNQFALITHLYQFFGKLLGCSGYGKMGFPAYQGNPNMYEVHKFMDLNQNQIGYFIQQVGLAAASFGVADADVKIVGGALQKLFNYKCSPPVDIGVGGGALPPSMCVNPSCPLDPMAMCDKYPYGGNGYPPELNPTCAAPPPPPSTMTTMYTKPYEPPKETKTWDDWHHWHATTTEPPKKTKEWEGWSKTKSWGNY